MYILEDIKNICNYSEQENNTYSIHYNYIEYVTYSKEDLLRQQKEYNRKLTLDILTGDKEDSEWDNRQSEINDCDTIQMQVKSLQLSRYNYNSLIDIKNHLLDKIENLTYSSYNKMSLDISLSTDYEVERRKILSRILMCSNLISKNNYRGPATTLITHPITYNKYIKEIESSLILKVIYSTLISKDKIILTCTCDTNTLGTGLILIHSPNDKCFYSDITENGKDNFIWFNLK